MNETSNWLLHDHRKYDALLTECEMAAGMADWKDTVHLFNEFVADLKLHMQMEDEVLYPFFEEEVSDAADKIAVLYEEHENLVRLLRDMVSVIKTKNIELFTESVLLLHGAMNKHNYHEEVVFQCLGENSLLTRRDEIMARLHALKEKEGHEPRNWGF